MGKTTCEVTRNQLESLKSDPAVGAVEEFREEENSGPELSTLAVSGFNPGPIPSGAGLGVHAATFEVGLGSSFVSCLGVPVNYESLTGFTGEMVRHTEAVFKTLVHAAPSATFYHHHNETYDGAADIDYLINNGIQTVSLSRARGVQTPYHSTYPEFLVMDDFAYRYPFPVFATPTHNNGYQYEVNWQCYNAISVGNVRHTNGTTFELAGCTQTKNPPRSTGTAFPEPVPIAPEIGSCPTWSHRASQVPGRISR
jgi:hypothetical protein